MIGDREPIIPPLTHPAFKDVYFYILKSFYVKEKKSWKLKVLWMHVKGQKLGQEVVMAVTNEKMTEFIKYNASEQRSRALSSFKRTVEIQPWDEGQRAISNPLPVACTNGTRV